MRPVVSAYQQDLYNTFTMLHGCEVANKVEVFNFTFKMSIQKS